MALAQEDLEQIQLLIRRSIAETPEMTNANVRYELDLRERTIRIEEELKHQREFMLTGFSQSMGSDSIDFIRDEKDYQNHVDYIHYNPVKHGYVQQAIDWRYSSFHFWVKRKVYPVDWAAHLDMDLG